MRKTKGILTESIELDEKQTPSDKVFHIVGLWCGSLACGMLLFNLILYFAAPDIAVTAWMLIFYPLMIVVVAGAFCSSAQLLRNPYFSSIIAFSLNVAAAAAAITVIVVQAVLMHRVYIVPFVWL